MLPSELERGEGEVGAAGSPLATRRRGAKDCGERETGAVSSELPRGFIPEYIPILGRSSPVSP